MSEENDPLVDFSGQARLFPLPNLVLFPHVVQPLHIFEPRYRQMTEDALASDGLIAMTLLKSGWEGKYEGQPEIYPVACLGQIVAEQRLEDGCFNILLRGLKRIRINQEVGQGKLYRQARVDLLDEVAEPPLAEANKYRRRLLKNVPPWFSNQGEVLEQFRKLIQSDIPLGVLVDIVTFALPVDVYFKQRLLDELDVETRAGILLRHLKKKKSAEKTPAVERPFPPEFSVN